MPMHPARILEAHPTAITRAAKLDFRCLNRFCAKTSFPFQTTAQHPKPPKRLTAWFVVREVAAGMGDMLL